MNPPSNSTNEIDPIKDISNLLKRLVNEDPLSEHELTQETTKNALNALYSCIKGISEENSTFNNKLLSQTRRILKSTFQPTNGQKEDSLPDVILHLLLESIIMNPETTSFEAYNSISNMDLFKAFFDKFPVYYKVHRFNSILYGKEITFNRLTEIKDGIADILKDYDAYQIGRLNNMLSVICFINEVKALNISKQTKLQRRKSIFKLFNTTFKDKTDWKIKELNTKLLLGEVSSVIKAIETDSTDKQVKELFISMLNKKEKNKLTHEGILKLTYQLRRSLVETIGQMKDSDGPYKSTEDSGLPMFDIPAELVKHSHFVCPVSMQEAQEGNPPVLLECGHMICKSTMDNISERDYSEDDSEDEEMEHYAHFNCPICRRILSYKDVREVSF